MRKLNKLLPFQPMGIIKKLEEMDVVDFVIDDFRDERLIQLFS